MPGVRLGGGDGCGMGEEKVRWERMRTATGLGGEDVDDDDEC